MQLDQLDYSLAECCIIDLDRMSYKLDIIHRNWKQNSYSEFKLTKKLNSNSIIYICSEFSELIKSTIIYINNLKSTLNQYRMNIIKAIKQEKGDSWELIRDLEKDGIINHINDKMLNKCTKITRKHSFEKFIFRVQKFITYIYMTYKHHGYISSFWKFIKNINVFFAIYVKTAWIPRYSVIFDTCNLIYIDKRLMLPCLISKTIKTIIRKTLVYRFKKIRPKEVQFIINPKQRNGLMMEMIKFYLKMSRGYYWAPIPIKYNYLYLSYYDRIIYSY